MMGGKIGELENNESVVRPALKSVRPVSLNAKRVAYMGDPELRQEVQALRAQNQRLKDCVADLTRRQEACSKRRQPSESQLRILRALLGGGLVSYGRLIDAIYHNRTKPKGTMKVLTVTMCRLRLRLAQHDIEILTERGRGYSLDEPSRQRLDALMNTEWRGT